MLIVPFGCFFSTRSGVCIHIYTFKTNWNYHFSDCRLR